MEQGADDFQTSGPLVQRLRRSLSAQLLGLTILFVLLAEVVVLIPSMSKQTYDWFSARTEAAYLVGLALEAPDAEMIDPQTANQLFATADILGVMVMRGGATIQIYAPELEWDETRPMRSIDIRDQNPFSLIDMAWSTMFSSGDDIIRVIGEPTFAENEMIDIFVSEAALRRDLFSYLGNILFLSLVISTLTASLVYWTLNRMIVKPVRRLTSNMTAFHVNPDERQNIIRPGAREDEIGDAERSLNALETRLHDLLTQRARLAALGAGVSKISHDLRNILASAQLMSDRLSKSDDPRVRKLSPRLIQSLDRAISLSRDTLSYARMEAPSLTKTTINLHELINEVFDDAAHLSIEFVNETPDNLSISADRTQLYRAIFNLARNSVEAMIEDNAGVEPPEQQGRITARAEKTSGGAKIEISDTGPGIPDSARQDLFEPFKGSLKPGGSGLGVAIAHEILRAHGGKLTLAETGPAGTTFRLHLPAD